MSKIVQLGGLLFATPNIFEEIIWSPANSITNSFVNELKNTDTKKLNNDILVDAGLNIIGKKSKKENSSITGLGITLINNETKYIIEVMKSFKKRENLLKGTTRKITSQEGGFLNVLNPLMTAELPLIKSVLSPLAKNVLIPLELSTGKSAADAAVQKKMYGSGTTALIIWNKEMGVRIINKRN